MDLAERCSMRARLSCVLLVACVLVLVAGCASRDERAIWKAVVDYYDLHTAKDARLRLRCDEIQVDGDWVQPIKRRAVVSFRLVGEVGWTDGAPKWDSRPSGEYYYRTAVVGVNSSGKWVVVSWYK